LFVVRVFIVLELPDNFLEAMDWVAGASFPAIVFEVFFGGRIDSFLVL
jgi:hypothetical protein